MISVLIFHCKKKKFILLIVSLPVWTWRIANATDLPLHKLQGEWEQALSAMISGIVEVASRQFTSGKISITIIKGLLTIVQNNKFG